MNEYTKVVFWSWLILAAVYILAAVILSETED